MKIERIPFEQAFISEAVGSYKIKESEYNSTGVIKVVDQGQNLISGFTDRADLARHNYPYIVFGDHTKAIKLIDFPFVVGADGVRLYKPADGFDAEFLYYFLKSANLPSDGYGRHSKYLNDLLVPNIDLEVQLNITSKLKALLAEVETTHKALVTQHADIKILVSTALDKLFAFSEKVPIGNCAKVQSGYAFKSKDFTAQGVKLLRNTNILPNKVYWDDTAYFPIDSIEQHRNFIVHQNDVILSLDRPIISSGLKVARISESDLPAMLVQRVGRFVIDHTKLDSDYLYYFLNTAFFRAAITGHDHSLGVPHISPSQVENIDIPLPDINQQKRIALLASKIFKEAETADLAIKEAIKDIEYLPSRLLAEAFKTLV